jgi:hypothetical protein
MQFTSLSYAALKQRAEALAVRWEWAAGPRYERTPHEFVRERASPARLLKAPPGRKNGAHHYGIAADGLVVVERQHVEFPGQFYETFALGRDRDSLWTAHYDYSPEKSRINRCHYRYRNDRLISWERTAQYGNTSEEYRWRDGRIVRIDTRHQGKGEKAWRSRYELEWDSAEVSRVTRDGFPVYTKTREDFASLERRVEAALLKEIPPAVRCDELAYCLSLDFCSDEYQHLLPPNLSVGLERERQEWKRQHGRRARDFVWSPAERATQLHLDGSPSLELYRLFNQEVCIRGSYWRAIQLLQRVAAKLAPIRLPKTPDFFVYAAQIDGDCRKFIPKDRRSQLKRDGWL